MAHDEKESGYFEYLLTKFSTPEEIFGPLSITELKQDRFKRNTAGYLPTVKIAFLDEIFKASSSILNALLTILNERVYHNGAVAEGVNLQALIAASNELPTDQEELSALYDRFLVRSFVDYVKADSLQHLFNIKKTISPSELNQLSAADLQSIDDNAESVSIPQDIVDTILRIWQQHKETFKEDRRESLSDRRLVKVLHLLRVSAATNGRAEVDLSDVLLLKDCLWNHQDNAIKVRDLILKALRTLSARPLVQSKIMSMSDQENRALASAAVKGGITEKRQFITRPSTGQLNAVVKGFKGGGTQQDPLLIGSIDELMDLSRPDVGLQGYYFRQTADIDSSKLTSWTDIDFKGHYDGAGYTVGSMKTGEDFADRVRLFKLKFSGQNNLFRSIQAQSSVADLNLQDLRLANIVEGSQIANCVSNLDLISTTATNCSVIACKAGQSLILDSALKCVITSCQSGSVLITETASYCQISDCLVVINYQGSEDECCGGIAKTINLGSVIERCFVTGGCIYSGSGFFYFYGISETCDDSIIRGCTLGKLDRSSSDVRVRNRITFNTSNNYTLVNNASIDSNTGSDERNGCDGATIAAARFNQRFLNIL